MAENFWCKEHNTAWFMRGKMRNYAHPISDENGKPTGQWCDMPSPAEVGEPQPSDSTAPAAKPAAKEMTKGDWAEKDKVTRTSIERQKSLDIATQWCIAQLQAGTKVTTKQVISIAIIFEGYITNGAETRQED